MGAVVVDRAAPNDSIRGSRTIRYVDGGRGDDDGNAVTSCVLVECADVPLCVGQANPVGVRRLMEAGEVAEESRLRRMKRLFPLRKQRQGNASDASGRTWAFQGEYVPRWQIDIHRVSETIVEKETPYEGASRYYSPCVVSMAP